MIQGHGGNIHAMARQLGCRPEDLMDMSSNLNPLGMPPGLRAYLLSHIHWTGTLPEVDADSAIAHMAALLDVDSHRILAGNGTTQFIYTACAALKSRNVLIVGPTYADYADACRLHHIQPQFYLAGAESNFAVDLDGLEQQLKINDTVFICNPNNPTGHLIPFDALQQLCRQHSETHFIIDESYLPFAAEHHSQSMSTSELDNVSVLWSNSKIFSMPGLRAGFLIANPQTIASFQGLMQPWSLNSLAQAAVEFLGTQRAAICQFIHQTRHYLETERPKFRTDLASRTGSTLFPSQASYLLVALQTGVNSDDLCRKMAAERVLIRNCSNFHGLSNRFVRIALKRPEENRLAGDLLAKFTQSPHHEA